MVEFKERNCFHFHFWGNETMDELKEKNCVNNFLIEVGRWMNFGNLTRKNRVMELWELLELCRGSGIVDELYKGSVLANKVAL
jgi:hypothetical protein